MTQAAPVSPQQQNLFTKYFKTIKDPRRTEKGFFMYPLNEILFLSISATLSGCNGWTSIQEFGENKLSWLRKFFQYDNGIPSHDVLGKLFSNIDSKAFNECFIQWINSISQLTNGEIVNLDGKTIKKSNDSTHKPLHIVSAYAKDNRLCLGQVVTNEKSNEITAIPDLLDMLSIAGCKVTIDAMGCQRKIADKIIDKEADYILMVKENQSELLEQVKKVFKITKVQSSDSTIDCEHGRVEERVCDVITDLRFLDLDSQWNQLNSIARVTSKRYNKKKETEQSEVRYYISSCQQNAEQFNLDIRSHWSIENNLHWNLDVIFNEDKNLKKSGNSAANFNIISKIALSMLERENSTKRSKPNKRLKAALSDTYREKLLKC